MKKILLSLLLFSILSSSMKALDASVVYATFKSLPDKAFVEIYLHVMGTTVNAKQIDSLQYQSAVNVLILIKQKGNIIQFKKYALQGPISKYPLDFMDVQRIGLEDGAYDLEVEIKDLYDSTNVAIYTGSFSIDYQRNTLMQSDLQMLRSIRPSVEQSAFAKNGFYMEPLPYNFYYKTDSVMIFYQELYASDKVFDDKFLLKYMVDLIKGNGDMEPVIMGHKKLKPQAVNVILVKKDISQLASGRYRLRVEVQERDGTIVSSKETIFDRSNPYRDEEILAAMPMEESFVAKLDSAELRYSLKAIAPIVDDASVSVLNAVIRDGDLEAQRRYLHSFWYRIDASFPKAAYEQYMEVARAVDKLYYSGFGYGFESDRGRIFMKYGKPSDIITVENEPSAPPYEIWFYDQVPTSPPQSNVKFLFYNPSLASGNFQLLHSTCRGEIQNVNWEVELYRDDTQALNKTDIDVTSMGKGLNRRAREYFDSL
ncbi:MAG TPA: GWxTD domain-containing protein [Phaeodactylibacter sp.]|nr:GWxTD domain-containing protein [Phaeodactylibacter sp.]